LFAEQNQLIPHAAWGPCYRDHGCQIAAIVIFREVLQKKLRSILLSEKMATLLLTPSSYELQTATETLFIQLKTRTGGDTRCTKDRSTEA
ncbi:hypothetical protein T03_16156, partial [Trichinella britovi]